MLAQGILPDAIVAYNDMMAIGILRALHERKIAVPEQISVVGFDNLVASQYSNPPLTTVGVSRDLVARLTVDTLMNMVSERTRLPTSLHHKLLPELIIRDSSKL